MKKKNNIFNFFGMTPPELLISIIIIGVMILAVIIYVDRAHALKKARDITRFNHTQVVLGSILRYEIDTRGVVPAGIDDEEGTWQMIEGPDGDCSSSCENKVVTNSCADLSVLVPDYTESIPQGEFFTEIGGSGYYINKSDTNIVTVGACITEASDKIIEIRQ